MFKEKYLQIYRVLASKYTSSQLDKVLNEITRCHNDLLNLPLSNSNTVLYRRASAINDKVKFTAPSSVKKRPTMPKQLREKSKSSSTALLEGMMMLFFTVITLMVFL